MPSRYSRHGAEALPTPLPVPPPPAPPPAHGLHPWTVRWLEDLPPFEQESRTIQATLDAIGRELYRIESAARLVRHSFFPSLAVGSGFVSQLDPDSQGFPYQNVTDPTLLGQMPATSGDLLAIFEHTFGLSAANKTVVQRRQAVVAYLQGLQSEGTGAAWEAALTRLVGTGWTYEEHVPGDLTTPPAYVIRIRVPFADQIAVPTGLVATPSTGAGSLVAGTYVYAITALNTYGETTPSTTASATLTATGEVALSWTADTGATGYGVYRGPDAGHLTKLIEVGTVASFTDDGTDTPLGEPPPSANTTRSLYAWQVQQLARQITPAHIEIDMSYGAGFIVGVSRVGDFI